MSSKYPGGHRATTATAQSSLQPGCPMTEGGTEREGERHFEVNGRLNLPARRRQLRPPVLLTDEKPSPSGKSLSLGLPHMTSAKYSFPYFPLQPIEISIFSFFQSASFAPQFGRHHTPCKSKRDMKRFLSRSFRSNVCNAANVVVRRVSPPFERKKERERPIWDRHRRSGGRFFASFVR